MNIDTLSTLVALILAVSLAAERLVAILKTIIPQLRSSENNTLLSKETGAGMSSAGMKGKYLRPLFVTIIAFLASWLTSAFLAEGQKLLELNKFMGQIHLQSGDNPIKIPVLLMAVLASGGSEFWKNILGYTKAARDIKIGERAGQNLLKKDPDERQALRNIADLSQPNFEYSDPRI